MDKQNLDEKEIDDGSDKDPIEERLDETELIEKTGEVISHNAKHLIHCLTVIGQVEGHYVLPSQNKTTKYEHIIPALVAIEQWGKCRNVEKRKEEKKPPTVSLVVGGGHSIGVPLAVSAKHSFIVPSATMTIHPVRMNGLVLGVPQTLSYFDKMQDRIVNFVTSNSNISDDEFRKLMMQTGELVMDVGTVVDGEKAVELGLIDSLGGLSDAIECLYSIIEESGEKYPDNTEEES